MTNKCFVTRLKGVVKDDSLERLGELRFKKAEVQNVDRASQYFTIKSADNAELLIIGDGGFYSDYTLSAISGNRTALLASIETTFWVTNGAEVSILPKYELESLQLSNIESLNIEQLQYCGKLNKLLIEGAAVNNISGNLDVAAKFFPSDMSDITFANINANIESLSHVAYKNIDMQGLNINGDISSINVARLEFLRIHNTHIYGTIESLVSNLIKVGRTSGTLNVPYLCGSVDITWKGVPLQTNSEVPQGAYENTLSWTADGQVTWS